MNELVYARLAVTFSVAEHHYPLASIKVLYGDNSSIMYKISKLQEALCELAHSLSLHESEMAKSRTQTRDLLIGSLMP